MGLTSYGTDITAAAVTNQNKQSIAVSNNYEFNGTAVVIQTVDYNDQSLLPSINASHPTLAGYILTTLETEQLPGGICRANLTYTNHFQSLPSTTYVEQASIQEAPIQEHPSFSTWVSAGYWDSTNNVFTSTSPFYGVSSFRLASANVIKTEYFDSQPSSRFSNLTQLEMPDGSYPGTAVNWMIIASNRRQYNANWTRETNYEYGNWNTGIYSLA